MSRVDELLAELRQLVDESRDAEMPDFFHVIDTGAWLASVFDQLDQALSAGGELPQEWSR